MTRTSAKHLQKGKQIKTSVHMFLIYQYALLFKSAGFDIVYLFRLNN